MAAILPLSSCLSIKNELCPLFFFHSEGTGPVYQGRFKSFPIQEGDHFLTVCRYVERNALRAGLVKQAENWRWSSLWHRLHQTQVPWLSEWPIARPGQWTEYVNGAETESELAALRRSVVRGAPYGDAIWQKHTAEALGLQSAFRARGRQRQAKGEDQPKSSPYAWTRAKSKKSATHLLGSPLPSRYHVCMQADETVGLC